MTKNQLKIKLKKLEKALEILESIEGDDLNPATAIILDEIMSVSIEIEE